MQHLTHASWYFSSCFTVCEAGLLYHETFQEVYTHRRKEVESIQHGAVKELTSEYQGRSNRSGQSGKCLTTFQKLSHNQKV